MENIKKPKSFTHSYRPVVIWFGDLAEIISSLKAVVAKDVEISTEDYRFTTIGEAKEHLGSQTQFQMEITSSSPYVRIQFTRMSVNVHVSHGPQSA